MPTKKTQVDDGIISSPEPKKSGKKTVSKTTVGDDIIGSNIPVEPKIEKPKQERKLTVAIHSTKNVIWEGVGKVEKGYNIVSKAEAEKWLTRNHIRLATPEEVAREYGV